jgi:transposase
MRYLGVDLHSNNFTVCFLTGDGTHTFEKYHLKELEGFKRSLRADDRVAVEATGNSRHFHSEVAPLVAECVVVNTMQFKVISQSASKTDRNDARALAQFLSLGLLPSARVKDEQHAQVKSLAEDSRPACEAADGPAQQGTRAPEGAGAGEPQGGLRPPG